MSTQSTLDEVGGHTYSPFSWTLISAPPLTFADLAMLSPSRSQLTGLSGFDPDNIQPWIMQVVISMTALALLAVGLRLLSRRFNSQTLWWDDWMIIFSMVCSGFLILLTYQT